MTNTPGRAIPINTGGDEHVPADTTSTRPTADKVTPSQQGQFQGALERKTDEKGGKSSKKASGTDTTKKSSEEGGVFQLAATRKAQGEESSVDVGTEEESSGEAGQGFLPKKNISTEPSTEQVVAAGQSQIVTQPTLSVDVSQTKKTSSVSSVSSVSGTAALTAAAQTQQTNVAATEPVVTKPVMAGTTPSARIPTAETPLTSTAGTTVAAQKTVAGASSSGTTPLRRLAPSAATETSITGAVAETPITSAATETSITGAATTVATTPASTTAAPAAGVSVTPKRAAPTLPSSAKPTVETGSVSTAAVTPTATPTAADTTTVTPTTGQTPSVSPKIGQKGAESSVSQKVTGGTTKAVVGEKKTTTLGATAQVQVREQAIATPTATGEADTTAKTAQTRQAALLQVISQAAEAITTFVSKDVTSTVVTIRQPPIFEGATLTVTEYTTSPQQFNITFANLSPDARRMIESVANQQQLKQALVDRGYTVQNIVIESAPKKTEAIATTEASGGQGGAEGQETSGEGGEGAGDAEGGVT